MDIALFDYELPKDVIAQAPVRPRERAKLLYYDAIKNIQRDHHVADLPQLLQTGDLLVFNSTKVRHARIFGVRLIEQKEILIEIVVVSPLHNDGEFTCLIRGKNVQADEIIIITKDVQMTVLSKESDETGLYKVRINISSADFLDVCEQIGVLPLPPYIKNPQILGFEDELYQPLTAHHLGSIAAPTASLHFSEKLLDELKQRGIVTGEVLLHVGLGTFLSVKVADTDNHHMHTEEIEVSQPIIDKIIMAKQAGKRVIAVGTTVARALESAAQLGTLQPYAGETSLFMTPGFEFKVIDGLLTNFHLPKSTLLMLVSAFIGRAKLFELYNYALANNYRFLSFGDCMLLVR